MSSVIVEGPNALYLGAQATLLDENRELAWAEKHVQHNPAYKWVLGKFVEANNPNDNGHLFDLTELRAAQQSIVSSPLNMLHRPHHIVGAFVATELVYPIAQTSQTTPGGSIHQVAASLGGGVSDTVQWSWNGGGGSGSLVAADTTTLHPYVEALAAFWRYYFPDEYRAIEQAHAEGSLYYSMECVPKRFECVADGCGQIFAYAGRQSPTYCEHLNAAGTTKKCREPHFTGGALIVPPVRPGWKRADITELSSLIEANLDAADSIYRHLSIELPHLDPAAWEQMMALLLVDMKLEDDPVMAELEPIDAMVATIEDLEALGAKDFSTDKRKQMSKSGTALPDGSFPIANVADLKNAISAFGRAKDKAAAKRHIIKRARALNATNLLPEGWS